MLVGTPGMPLKLSSKFRLPPKICMPRRVKIKMNKSKRRAR